MNGVKSSVRLTHDGSHLGCASAARHQCADISLNGRWNAISHIPIALANGRDDLISYRLNLEQFDSFVQTVAACIGLIRVSCAMLASHKALA
jgi:hypothetical protein